MNPLKGRLNLEPELWVAALALGTIAAVGGRWLSTATATPLEQPISSLARFRSLTPYFVAAEEVMPARPRLATAAWSNPFDSPRYTVARSPETPAPAQVTAILISQDRRLAIIGDRIVTVGDLLPGAGRVEAIEAGQVVVSRNGRREVLRLLPQTQSR
ncbi:hypothetical protein HRbin33_00235 [bacterium HR33]|nr:hypothetical protein HRbin33_00235 [bacterium HR33]